jgi:transcriptional regulator with XRE-family HTH domain
VVTQARSRANLRKLEANWSSAESRAAFARQFPYANVALAVVGLRQRHALTQQALADAVGTTQSVIARLESGQHPIEIRLLHRIAEAMGEPWSVRFGADAEYARDSIDAEARVAESGEVYETARGVVTDEILEAFNTANTSRDFDQAHEIAREIERAPTSPRRRLALALDAYNRREYDESLRWAMEAIETGDLPGPSAETAELVRASALMNLKRPREAIAVLRAVTPTHLGWRIPATLADAYLLVRAHKTALRQAREALAMAQGAPEARYIAARAAWHANLLWEALDHIAIYRASEPDDLTGLLLHGSILGYLGGSTGDRAAYVSALAIFDQARASGDCEAARLYSLTAAQLGRWRESFRVAKQYLAIKDHDSRRHKRLIHEQIIPRALDEAGEIGPEKLEQAANAAEQAFGPSRLISMRRAMSHAVRGDVDRTAAAFGVDLDSIGSLGPFEHLIVGVAYHHAEDHARALAIFGAHVDELPEPDGLVRLAECAIGAGDYESARRALERLADGGGPHKEVAGLAVAMLRAKDKQGVHAQLARLAVSEVSWFPVPKSETAGPARSPWEGRHPATSSVLDSLTRVLRN